MSTLNAERPEQPASAKPLPTPQPRQTPDPKTPIVTAKPLFTDWASI